MNEVRVLTNPNDWEQWAVDHAPDLVGVVAVHGEMGAGKTTAISYWLRAMGSNDRASSPTFALVNEYKRPEGPIYHFDLHRLDRPSEVAAMGFEDYLDSGQPCWVEWPDRAGALMPSDAISVHIQALEDGSRKVTFVGTYR